jgi:hypothetical protein
MYGTVNALCAQLLQKYRADEQIALIVWTKENVLAVLDDECVPEKVAAEILSQFDMLDGHHEYGVGGDELRSMLDNIQRRHEVCVPAASLMQVLRVAGDFMRLEDVQGGEGSAARLWPLENEAIREVTAAMKR